MRTVFVNPSRRRRRVRRSRRRNAALVANPRRRHRRRVRRVTRRSRRNAGIAPFVQSNPMIMNPRRRRRSRNPMGALGRSFSPKNFISKSLKYGGGAAIGAGANILLLRKIENTYLRNGLRVAGAVACGALLPSDMGGAAAGATLYPLFAELALMLNLVPAATSDTDETEADLQSLAADLQDVLDEVGQDEYEDLIDE